MKSTHTITVEVEWDLNVDDTPHAIRLPHATYWVTTDELSRMGVTRPGPPTMWRLLNDGETIEQGDEYYNVSGYWIATDSAGREMTSAYCIHRRRIPAGGAS